MAQTRLRPQDAVSMTYDIRSMQLPNSSPNLLGLGSTELTLTNLVPWVEVSRVEKLGPSGLPWDVVF